MKDPGPGYGPPKEWDVIIENDNSRHASLLGAIVVFTGILPIFQDEEQHCQKSVIYTAEQLSSASVALGLFALLAILGVDISLSNLIHTCFVDVPNSRTQKKEARIQPTYYRILAATTLSGWVIFTELLRFPIELS
ncbi:hypothetical protein CPC08DRAFT_767987 [Agrocybe pediades]|nr:hypothetical protein CPC08DRAFT_767987 [Agrocybe pediades]